MRNSLSLLGFAALLVLSMALPDHTKEEHEVEHHDDKCKCIPYYQCSNGTAIEDGASLIDIRIKDEHCENYLEVCCKVPKEGKVPHEPEEHPEEHHEWGSCGVRHPKGVSFRITGATDGEAQFGEFPWMTAILLSKEVKKPEGHSSHDGDEHKGKEAKLYLCGGALIHPHVVLTGAHCVEDHKDDKILVRVGEWDSQTSKEVYPHQDRVVSKIIIHEHFKSSSLFNDVALLYFHDEIKPAKHIGTVCLPKKEQVPPPKTKCLASGWGMTEFGKEGKYSTILTRVEVPVVAHDKCQHYLRQTRLGQYFKLHKSFICAGGEKGIDTCKGDGGSPLVCPHPDHPEHYIQSGLVAWGIGCNDHEVPGVYADVAHFRDWIDEHMNALELDSSYYILHH